MSERPAILSLLDQQPSCLMADCTEPRSHFCVTHCLDVHSPTIAQCVAKVEEMVVVHGDECIDDECRCGAGLAKANIVTALQSLEGKEGSNQ